MTGKKKKLKIIIISAAVVVAIVAALIVVRSLNTNKKVDVVSVAMINDQWWGDSSQYSGNVSAGRVQNVKLRNAFVENVNVKKGDYVNVGDTLMVYDATEYQVTLQQDAASIAVLEAQIDQAKRAAWKYQCLKPKEEAPQPVIEIIDHGPLEIKEKLTDKDYQEDQQNFLVSLKTKIEPGFLKLLRENGKTAVLTVYENDTKFAIVEIDGSKIPFVTYEYELVEPESKDEPTEGPEEGGEGEESGGEPEPLYRRIEKEFLTEDWVLENAISFDGTSGHMNGHTKYYLKAIFCKTEKYERYEEVIHYPEVDPTSEDYVYTRAELAQKVKDKTHEADRLEQDLMMAKITLQKDQLTASSGEVKATVSGTVTEVNNVEQCAEGDTVIVVKGTENFTITISVDELSINTIKPGDKTDIIAYESGTKTTATISEIGKVPVGSNFGIPNCSYYPVEAIVDDSEAQMIIGEYCQVTFHNEDETPSTSLYIPIMYVRSDDGGDYVMKNNNGRLVKQYVITGKNLYGSEIEIKSGLLVDDFVAFPYGSGSREGVPTVVSEQPVW
ncbi:MAG: HlyD family efflux transporter periplasmic adaptor subunit [Lachnospiraceae bacterium]|nr:HlyD family efflux transporter periplasmic adaptor subunit [Lachnospiraceae bacterium]